MKKTLVALLLVLVMALPVAFAACQPEQDTNKVILGNSTAPTGDFIFTGLGKSSSNAADQDVQKLTTGYGTMEVNQQGSYTWNKTSVKSHSDEEITHEDGSVTYKITIEINPGLKMSGGTEVKAANYLAYIMAVSSSVGQTFVSNKTGESFVGFNAFKLFDGTNDGKEVKTTVKGSDGQEKERTLGTASKAFAGLRLLGEYKFSLEISADYYPYYFAYTYGAVDPYDLALVLGEGTEVKDDGQGAYLSGNWYEKKGSDYAKKELLVKSQYDYTNHEYTGPYTITKWNSTDKEATLTINPNYAGNFEGQKPSIKTIVLRTVVEETQFQQLSKGEVDIISGLTGGESVKQALSLVDTGKFSEVHYDRAGYGKVQFDCDFGPTMFTEVRQAMAYCLDRQAFANSFCTGYGSIVNGPYSVNFAAYSANKKAIDALNPYAVSVENAKKVLKDGGWVYNADGTDYDEAKGGVRYKKLAATEYGVDNANLTYASVENSDGKEYKTVKIGEDYYMPCVINWFATKNDVSELLVTMLMRGTNLTNAGIVLRQTIGEWENLLGNIYRETASGYSGTPTYNMFNLATGWNSEIYDYSFNWVDKSSESYDDYFTYSNNKLSDPYDAEFQWDVAANQGLSYDEAVKKSGNKLGMNYLSMAMVYSAKPGDHEEYNKWFLAYLQRWNELIPDLPLYSNIYYDCFNAKIQGFKTSPFFGPAYALIYCTVK